MSERLIAEAQILKLQKELNELHILTSGLRLKLRLDIPSESQEPDITNINLGAVLVQVADLQVKVERIQILKKQISNLKREWGF